jgi:hypothetical protein
MFSSFKVHKTFVNHQHLPKILISNMAAPQIASSISNNHYRTN